MHDLEQNQPEENTPHHRVEEERPEQPKIGRQTMVLLAAGFVILFILVLFLLLALDDGGQKPAPAVNRDQLAQQTYDRKKQAKADKKAATLKDQPYVDKGRPEPSEAAREWEQLLRQRQPENPPPEEPNPAEVERRANRLSLVERIMARQRQAEESPDQPSGYPGRFAYDTRENRLNEQKYEDDRRERDLEKEKQPMFVYSRSYRKASYYDGEDQPAGSAAADRAAVSESFRPPPAREKTVRQSSDEEKKGTRQEKTELNTVLFSSLPPVRIAEGEFINTVLTHRIIADTEESPVVCAVAQDLIDNSGRFVVIPAGTRVVGASQVVNYMGASRLFINLRRMILPNGAAVDFPAGKKVLPALDRTGALGAVTEVNRHWLLQFGAAIFVGVLEGLGGAAQQHTTPYSGPAYMIQDTSDNFEKILNTIMQRYSNIVPTLTVGPGYAMKVFLTEDVLISPYAQVTERSYAMR